MAYDGTIGAILSNYDEALKTFYLPAVQETLNNDTILANIVEVDEESVSGKNATINCHYGRSKGTFARADGGAFGDGDYQKYKTATVPMKYQYGRIVVSGPTIAATRDEKGAYVKALDSEIRGIVKDVKKEVNRQVWGCGYGTLARWRDGTGTAITLQKKYRGNSAGGDGFGSTFGAKYFDERPDGVPVVLATMSASGTFTVDATDIDVSAITEGSFATGYDSITATDPAVTEAAGTFYVRPANLGTYAAAGAHRLEMMGLRGIVTDEDIDEIAMNDGTNTGGGTNDPLQTLAVATYSWWKAQTDFHSSGRYAGQRALSFELMQKMFDKVEEKAGEDYGPNLILTTRAVRRAYLNLCVAERRQVNTMTLDGGWKALDYNGVPLTVDNDAIDGEMYFLTTKDLKIFRMSDYEWMQKDGAVLSRVANYDAYEAVLFRYAEFGCLVRRFQGVLGDLAYSG